MAKKNARKAGAHVKEQKEFEEEVLEIARVTRVVKGGRRLRFRVTVAIGDKKGRVGVGVGKASEVVTGIHKAVSKAKASLINVPITKGDTIPHAVRVKYKAAQLIILPASPGTGVIAGGSLRKILHLVGVKNVLSKNIGSRNTLVTAQAAIKALQALRPVRESQAKKEEDKKPEEVKETAPKDEGKAEPDKCPKCGGEMTEGHTCPMLEKKKKEKQGDKSAETEAPKKEDKPLDDQSQKGKATKNSTDVGGLDDQVRKGNATKDDTGAKKEPETEAPVKPALADKPKKNIPQDDK